jgi:hypothetical protein
MSKIISEADVEFFHKNGWLLTDTLVGQIGDVQKWVDEIAAWPVRSSLSCFSALLTLSI